MLTPESFRTRTGDFHPTTITPVPRVPMWCTGELESTLIDGDLSVPVTNDLVRLKDLPVHSDPIATATMRRIRIRHLLLATMFAAIAFAVARKLDYVSTQFAMVMALALLPSVCYCIGELVAPSMRSLRQRIRSSLLSLAFVVVVAFSLYAQGAASLFSLVFILFVIWTPQFLLLKTCSAYRCVLIGAPF